MIKNQHNKILLWELATITLIILCFVSPVKANASTLVIPQSVTTIEEEAFFGDTSLDEISLPNGIININDRAFAMSSVSCVYFPSSIEYIAADAFDGTNIVGIGFPGVYAQSWCEEHGFEYVPYSTPVDNFTWSIKNNSITITKYSGNDSIVVVPNEIDSLPVTVLGASAFSRNKTVEQVFLPSSLTKIDSYAFSNCSALSDVTIPDNVVEIGGSAFENCTGLTTFDYPLSLATASPGIFRGCTGLKQIVIPEGVVALPTHVFSNAKYIESVQLPQTLETIGSYSFSGCYSLNTITIPDNVKKIGDHAFDSCSSLTELVFPDSIEEIGYSALQNCTGLTEFHYPLSLKTTYPGIFRGCTGIEQIVVQEGVTALPTHVFSSANCLKTVQLPQSLLRIGSYAFNECGALYEIAIPNGVTSIGDHAFDSCSSLTDLEFPDSVQSIGGFALNNCTGLTEFHYPLSLKEVGGGFIFYGCSGITEISVPNGVTKIPGNMFGNSNYLESIQLPESIKNIGYGAFADCTALTTLNIPDSVEEMGPRAYENCTALTEIHYPLSLKTTGGGSNYRGCSGIKAITVPEGVKKLPASAFSGSNYLEKVILPTTLEEIGMYAFSDCSVLTDVNIPDTVTTIESWAFDKCSALEKVYIGYNVTTIGNYVFNKCTALTVWCEYASAILQYCKNNSVPYYYLTPDGVNSPSGTIYKGDGYSLHGYARSSLPLSNITATIWNSNKTEAVYSVTVTPGTNDYALSGTINNNMLFSKLNLGNYCYTLTASTTLSEEVWADTTITVVPPPLRVGITGFTEFSNIVFDSSVALSGVVHANYTINTLKVSLINNNKTEVFSRTVYPSSKSYSLSNISLDLSSVSTDSYTIKITVSANGETKTVLQTPISVNSASSTPQASQELKDEIIEYVRSTNVGIFWPIAEADSYLANMSTWDKILMGLSDYNSLALSKFTDWLSGSDYNSYMEKKYEAEIAQIIDDMYKEGKVGKLKAYGDFGKLIKDVNGLVGDVASYELDDLDERIDNLEVAFGAPGQFEEMDALELVKDSTGAIKKFYKGVKYGEDFINFLSEMLTDHSRALEALEIISETYNSQGNPEFTAALNTLKASYKSKLGKAVIAISRRIGEEVMKTTEKTITKAVLQAAGASAGSLYGLADTAAEMVIKYSGIEELGQSKIDFLTQYTSAISLQRAYENACMDALNSNNIGNQLTDRQVNRIQVSFIAARQALLRLYQTLLDLDSSHSNKYNQAILDLKHVSMPGVDELDPYAGGGSR